MSVLKVRPIGQRIRQCLAVIDTNQAPMTAREVWNNLEGVSIENSSKYCLRSVGLGLMTVNREIYPMVFQCQPNWKALLEQRITTKTHVVPNIYKPRINSVWSLAL